MVNLLPKNQTLPLAINPTLKPLTTIASTFNIFNIESTALKFGQQYIVKKYNSDGSIITKTISLSSLQTTNDSFSPELFTPQKIQETAQQANLKTSSAVSIIQATSILQKSAKIDYSLCVKSQPSTVLEFNTLRNPSNFDADLKYNFYTSDEADTESQEDPNKDPFLTNTEVPRYVNLTWDTVETVNPSDDFNTRTKEENQLVSTFLKNSRGNSSALGSIVKNSFESFLKLIPSVIKDGKSLQLVDTHDLSTAFNSISNPGIYKNSTSVVFNVNAPNFDSVNIDDLVLGKLNE